MSKLWLTSSILLLWRRWSLVRSSGAEMTQPTQPPLLASSERADERRWWSESLCGQLTHLRRTYSGKRKLGSGTYIRTNAFGPWQKNNYFISRCTAGMRLTFLLYKSWPLTRKLHMDTITSFLFPREFPSLGVFSEAVTDMSCFSLLQFTK